MPIRWDDEAPPQRGVIWDDEPPDAPTSDRLREGTSPRFSGLTAEPPEENWLVKSYRDYVAEPLTKAASFMGEYDPMEAAQKWSGRPVTNQWPHLAAPGTEEARQESEDFARVVVPQTPAGGAGALAGLAVGGAGGGLLANILGPAAAAGLASWASGNEPTEVAADTALHGATGGVTKGLAQGGSWLLRTLPWMKGLINESQASGLKNVLTGIDPAAGAAVGAQDVSRSLVGGRTMAQMRQAATGQDIAKAASGTMETAIQQIDAMSGNPTMAGPALNEAYDMLDDVVKNHIIGPIGINGYTLKQAQAIRAELGGKAFSKAAADRGISDAALELLRGKVTGEMESFMAPQAVPLWRAANQRYGGVSVLDEFLNEGAAKQGLPNQMLLNRNTLSDYLDVNRADLIRRMGREQYDTIVREVLGGAQPGTRDILTPGSGGPLAALKQTLFRGTNTGSVNTLGVPLRTGLPNIGSEYTGRAPLSASDELQALLNYLGQSTAEKYQGAVRGVPIKIGDTYGR